MLLSINHRTHYQYAPAASRVALRMKLFPTPTASQVIKSWSVTVNGQAPTSRLTNGFGDDEAIWLEHGGATDVEVVAKGQVSTTDTKGVLQGWKQAARPSVFLRSTDLTAPDEAIDTLAHDTTAGKTGLEAAHALSSAVREAVDYRPGVTTADTTAAEALKQGSGVCQDHAHVLITAARTLNMAARYVVGYLFIGDGDSEDLVSQAETHAWAEIWIDTLGWVGFDPSNGICPTDHYIRLASGLDAPDASPLRGSINGMSEEHLTAEVQVIQSQQ